MQRLGSLRRTLIRTVLSLLIITCCYLAIQSRTYRTRVSQTLHTMLHVTLLTVLERNETVLLEKRLTVDDQKYDSIQQESYTKRNESIRDYSMATFLQEKALQLQEQVKYNQEIVLPTLLQNMTVLQEEHARNEQQQQQTTMMQEPPTENSTLQQQQSSPGNNNHYWCDTIVLSPLCHLLCNTAGLADYSNTTQQQQQDEHLRMIEQEYDVDAWIVQVLYEEDAAYTETAQELIQWSTQLQEQAYRENQLAQDDWQEAIHCQEVQVELQDQIDSLEDDIQQNKQIVYTLWNTARRNVKLAYGTGLAALCIAVSVLVVLLWSATMACGGGGELPFVAEHLLLLRRFLISWIVVGVVNDSTSMHWEHERALWIMGLATLMGTCQALVLHDYFQRNTSWERHVRILTMDSMKFSVVSVMHILTIWLVCYGVLPMHVVVVLLHWRTQVVLVAVYVVVASWEVTTTASDETTSTVLTGEFSESSPLQSSTKQSYGDVIYVGSLLEEEDTYTTCAHAGWFLSWDLLLMVCWGRVLWIAYPCILLHPWGSAVVLFLSFLFSAMVVCQNCDTTDGRLPRTIVL